MTYVYSLCKYFENTRRLLNKGHQYSFQQVALIFSKTGKWDEEFATPEVLKEVEAHWKNIFNQQQHKHGSMSGENEKRKEKKYVLPMFPYPSGQLHMGHVRVYTVSDTLARYYHALGYQVIHPIGWDAFGLPAENAAIEHNVSPASWTKENIKHMRQQLLELGCCFDWWREVCTSDPNYYRWTQQLFLQLYNSGLVYRKKAPVNWDPVDQTVLADEQVDLQGRAWRSGAVVERKLLDQWYIRTTRFSPSLYSGLESPQLQDWRSIIPLQQKWIGQCSGFSVDMMVQDSRDAASSLKPSLHAVFVEQPELLWGLSFLGVRSDHVLAETGYELGIEQTASVAATHGQEKRSHDINTNANNKSGKASAPADSYNVTCNYRVLGAVAVNPLSQELVPIIVSDDLPYRDNFREFYLGFGAGSLFDQQICNNASFDVVEVLKDMNMLDYIKKSDKDLSVCTITEDDSSSVDFKPTSATLINSGSLSGLSAVQARDKALATLMESGTGLYPSSANLKDWLVSRQRYWGTPIPMVHCEVCGAVPVPADQLPVLLPPVRASEGEQRGDEATVIATLLKNNKEWMTCDCPKCGGTAQRETDTLDTFVDSSWYFLRYLDPGNTSAPFDKAQADPLMPVDVYVGGIEHAVLHLYYARFFQHFLHSQGMTDHLEPFNRLLLVGRIQAPAYVRVSDGKYLPEDAVDLRADPPVERATGAPTQTVLEKMSKSKHNGVVPGAAIACYSCDIVRVTVLRGESPSSNRAWHSDSPVPVVRWMNLMWRTVGKYVELSKLPPDSTSADETSVRAACTALCSARNRTVANVTQFYNKFLLNSAIRCLETFTHDIRSVPPSSLHSPEGERSIAALLLMLAPMAPHFTAELWAAFSAHSTLYKSGAVQEQRWPHVDDDYQPPVRLICFVNDQVVYKTELSQEESNELHGKNEVLDSVLQRTDVVLGKLGVGGTKNIIRSSLEKGREGSSLKLYMYTMEKKELQRWKKEAKERRKKEKEAGKL